MNYLSLIKAINSASTQFQGRAAVAVNQALVMRNWMIGAWIIRFQKQGADRAKYGDRLYARLAGDLAQQHVRGCGERMLQQMTVFHQLYPQIAGAIPQTLFAEFGGAANSNPAITDCGILVTLSPDSHRPNSAVSNRRIPDTASTESGAVTIRGAVSPELPTPLETAQLLQLSWSQVLELIRIDDPWKRAFYENECLKGNWSVRQLQRQVGSLLYERTGLSKNKAALVRRAHRQEPQESITDLIRDPYILEFTGLAERPEYLESDLEHALLDHLQAFLLELGEGFCFEARQKRVAVGNKHNYIDLVFYHRRLRCHVLIDLKIRPFQHGDAGQMNFYLNWWKAHGMEKDDLPPVGIILCSDREHAEVEFATSGLDNKLFVSRYLVVLPSPEKLRAFLEADRDRIESLMPQAQAAKKRAPRKPKH